MIPNVARIRETIEIDAPTERVWAVVAEDVKNAPKWTSYLEKVEKLDDGPPGKGTRYRYLLNLPGGNKVRLEVEQDVYNKSTRCAGRGTRAVNWWWSEAPASASALPMISQQRLDWTYASD